jgi:hypothetical protein
LQAQFPTFQKQNKLGWERQTQKSQIEIGKGGASNANFAKKKKKKVLPLAYKLAVPATGTTEDSPPAQLCQADEVVGNAAAVVLLLLPPAAAAIIFPRLPMSLASPTIAVGV